MKSFRRILISGFLAFHKVYRFNRSVVILGLFIALFASIQSNLNIFLSKTIVDYLTSNHLVMLLICISALILLQLFQMLLSSYGQLKSTKLSKDFAIHCENELIELVANTELIEKEHPKYKGDFSYWSYINSKYYQSYVTITELGKYSFMSILSLYYLFYSYWIIGIMALGVGILKGWYDLRAVHQRVFLNEEIMRKSRSHHYYFDLLTGSASQKEMMLFQLFNYFRGKWKTKKREVNGLELQLETLNLKRTVIGNLFSLVNMALIIGITAFLINKGLLTVGDYVGITMALTLTESNISFLFRSISQLTENETHMQKLKRIEDMVHGATRLQQRENAKPFIFQDSIRIEHLTFQYPNRDEPAVYDLHAKIKKGETIAILGENGSGKSTFIKLLLGLYRSQNDSIYVDGVNLRDIDRTDMWRKTSAIFQDYVQYMTDVRDNIAVGNISDIENTSKLNAVLEKMGLSKAFKNGLDSRLGFLEDDSINLSGGQWQRLALSRVFIREQDELVVFDEPTSALDPVSEIQLMDEILQHCQNKTVVLISHRVGVARQADRIFVMDHGTIAESGTHEELLLQDGIYSQMWHQQKQWYESSERKESVSCP